MTRAIQSRQPRRGRKKAENLEMLAECADFVDMYDGPPLPKKQKIDQCQNQHALNDELYQNLTHGTCHNRPIRPSSTKKTTVHKKSSKLRTRNTKHNANDKPRNYVVNVASPSPSPSSSSPPSSSSSPSPSPSPSPPLDKINNLVSTINELSPHNIASMLQFPWQGRNKLNELHQALRSNAMGSAKIPLLVEKQWHKTIHQKEREYIFTCIVSFLKRNHKKATLLHKSSLVEVYLYHVADTLSQYYDCNTLEHRINTYDALLQKLIGGKAIDSLKII